MANYTRYSKKKESKAQLANEFSWLSLKAPQTHIHKILKEGEGFCKPCGEGVYLTKDTLENHRESNKHKKAEKIITSKQRIADHPNFIIKKDEEGIQKLVVLFSSTNISFSKIQAYYSPKVLNYICQLKKHICFNMVRIVK